MRIKVILSKDRRYTSRLLYNDLDFPIAAPTNDSLVPKIGHYQFKRIIHIAEDRLEEQAAYGIAAMYFSKETIQGKEDIVAIHGGDADSNGHLFPSMEGLRLTDRDLTTLLLTLGDSTFSLEVVEEDISLFQRLRRKRLSDEDPPRVSEYEDSDDSNLLFWLYTIFQDDPSPISVYQGGGGTFSAAGASGSWGEEDKSTPTAAAMIETGPTQSNSVELLPLIVDPFKEPAISEDTRSTPAAEATASEPERSEPTVHETSPSGTSY